MAELIQPSAPERFPDLRSCSAYWMSYWFARLGSASPAIASTTASPTTIRCMSHPTPNLFLSISLAQNSHFRPFRQKKDSPQRHREHRAGKKPQMDADERRQGTTAR